MIEFITGNKELIAEAVLALLAVGAIIVRLTPTEKDDGIFAKIDAAVNKVFDFLKLPNNKK